MQRIVDPRQTRLFDPFDPVLDQTMRRRLENDWPGVFRHVILELMPVETLAGHFHPTLGRPTKELYSMAGLVLLGEWMNWTKPKAVEAYCFYMNVQYALNLEPMVQKLSRRTLERYLQLFEQDNLAARVLRDVTTRRPTPPWTRPCVAVTPPARISCLPRREKRPRAAVCCVSRWPRMTCRSMTL